MLICDTHADTLWAMANHALKLDVTKEWLSTPGDVRVQALSLFVHSGGMQEQPTIVARELEQLALLKAQGFRQITRLEDALPGEANILLTIEGGEAFGDTLEGIDRMAAMGVRVATLTWNTDNLLAQPALCGNDTGIKPFGRLAVQRMQQQHIAVDVSHLNERGFWELMEAGVHPMASHSCAWGLCRHARNLKDDQLRALFETHGYVGVNFYACFLSEDNKADINCIVDHMAYMCDRGGEDCVGFGSDFDGIDVYPDDLKNAGDIPLLIDRMRRRGFGEKLVEKIAGLNFKRYLESV